MRPTARHAATALCLLCLAASTWPGAAVDPPAPCADWIGVQRAGILTLRCGVDPALSAILQRCPVAPPIRRGDRVVLSTRCPTVAPLGAARRLALGLRVDVNSASSSDLQVVSGIGPALARRIIAGRPYSSLEALERVRGIGPTRRRRLTASLSLAPPPLLWPSSTPRAASTPRRP